MVAKQNTKKAHTDVLERINEWNAFFLVPNCLRNHHVKFEIERAILTCINQRSELFVMDMDQL